MASPPRSPIIPENHEDLFESMSSDEPGPQRGGGRRGSGGYTGVVRSRTSSVAGDAGPSLAARPPPPCTESECQTPDLEFGIIRRRDTTPVAPVIMLMVAPLILLLTGCSYSFYWRALFLYGATEMKTAEYNNTLNTAPRGGPVVINGTTEAPFGGIVTAASKTDTASRTQTASTSTTTGSTTRTSTATLTDTSTSGVTPTSTAVPSSTTSRSTTATATTSLTSGITNATNAPDTTTLAVVTTETANASWYHDAILEPLSGKLFAGTIGSGFVVVNFVVAPLCGRILTATHDWRSMRSHTAFSFVVFSLFFATPAAILEYILLQSIGPRPFSNDGSIRPIANVSCAITAIAAVVSLWYAYALYAVDFLQKTVQEKALAMVAQSRRRIRDLQIAGEKAAAQRLSEQQHSQPQTPRRFYANDDEWGDGYDRHAGGRERRGSTGDVEMQTYAVEATPTPSRQLIPR